MLVSQYFQSEEAFFTESFLFHTLTIDEGLARLVSIQVFFPELGYEICSESNERFTRIHFEFRKSSDVIN